MAAAAAMLEKQGRVRLRGRWEAVRILDRGMVGDRVTRERAGGRVGRGKVDGRALQSRYQEMAGDKELVGGH